MNDNQVEMMTYKRISVGVVNVLLLFCGVCVGDTYWQADVSAGAAWSNSGNWTDGLPDVEDRVNFTNMQATEFGVNMDVNAVSKKMLIYRTYIFNGTGSIEFQPASTAHWDKVIEVNALGLSPVFNADVTIHQTTDFVPRISVNASSILTFNGALTLTNSANSTRQTDFSAAGATGFMVINGDLHNECGMRFGTGNLTTTIGGGGGTYGRSDYGAAILRSGRLELNRARALINTPVRMEGITLVLGADHALASGVDLDFRAGLILAEGYDQTFGTLDVADEQVMLDMNGSDSIFSFEDSCSTSWGTGNLVITNAASATVRFAVDSGSQGLLDSQIGQIVLNGKSLREVDVLLADGWLYLTQPAEIQEPVGSSAPQYVGFYRGEEMAKGIYGFTDLTDPLGTSTRIGSWPFPKPTYETVGFDGAAYFVLNRGTTFGGPGLNRYDGATSFSSISDSQTYSDWHGIGACNEVYYGLYSGTGLTGAGLYIFMDPTDPEGTYVRLFEDQSFSSNVWKDVAFDGEHYLFVRDDSDGGTPGIYQYEPDHNDFLLVSGSETYSDWQGLGVFDSDLAPLRNKKAYVLLFGGQSNALGWGYRQYLLDTGNSLAMPQDDVDMLYSKAGAGYLPEDMLLPLQSGNSNTNVKDLPNHYPALTNAPVSRFGPELNFARRVRDLISVPDSRIGVVKFAHGGSSLYDTTDWRPDGTADRSADGNLYQIFQRTAWRGIAAMKNKYPMHEVEVLGMGWVQGESDALETQGAAYEENLTRLVADVRATFGTNLTFVLSKISLNQIEGTTDTNKLVQWPMVMAAQDAVAAADPKVVATDAEGANYAVSTGLKEGQYHYTSASLLQIGDDLAQALVSVCGVDLDDDGMLDSWENNYAPGTTGLGGSADADYDEDGMTDLEEFKVGTSPVDPDDRLELSMDSALQGSWPASQDVNYRVMQSTNLISWTKIGSPVLLRESKGMAAFDFSNYTQAASSGFFRVEVD